jgi:alcohol dehydrogenase
LKRGDRLVACGSISGRTATINPMQPFQQRYRAFKSFAATMRHITESLDF